NVVGVQANYQIGTGDAVLQFAPTTFDTAIEQIFSGLLHGARLVLRDRDLWSPAELLEKIRQQQVSVMDLTPVYWHDLLAELTRHPEANAHLSSVRLMIVGGEALNPDDVAQWLRTTSGIRLVNAYGPTEATITSTIHDVPSEQEHLSSVVAIGRPLANR